MEIAEVDCPCPPLFSVEGMRDLGVALNFDENKIHVRSLDIEVMEMHMAPSGHPLLLLMEFTDTTHVPDEFLTYYAQEELSEEETAKLNDSDEKEELALLAEITHRMPIKTGVQRY